MVLDLKFQSSRRQWHIFSNKTIPLDPARQSHQVTKHSNIWTCRNHFYSNHPGHLSSEILFLVPEVTTLISAFKNSSHMHENLYDEFFWVQLISLERMSSRLIYFATHDKISPFLMRGYPTVYTYDFLKPFSSQWAIRESRYTHGSTVVSSTHWLLPFKYVTNKGISGSYTYRYFWKCLSFPNLRVHWQC